ncbi:MAG: hypothetical protein QGG36_03515 [Pirellulaceae bacterium]|jgi:hypothetical protein|nr:hypothetical protein [Pirellulaceae bacterium]
MSEYEQLLNQIASRPHHVGNRFVRDGILDEARWASSPRKTLFLLREAYEKQRRPEGFDQREKIRGWGKPKGKTLRAIANWAFAAHRGTPSQIPVIMTDNKPERAEACLACAIVNVKKSGGESRSDLKQVAKFCKLDGDKIRDQIEMIDPEIIICGGTWREARQFIWPNDEKTDAYARTYRIRGRFVVDFWHPANQFPKVLNYYALGCLLQNSGALESPSQREA